MPEAASLIVVLTGAVLTAGQLPAGQQTPTFQVEVDYLEVDVVVTDQQGRFVRDLKQEEFQISEDAKPQTISGFTVVDIPIERAARPLLADRPIEADVWTNAKPFSGRVYVMVIDDLHTMSERADRVRNTARQFIEKNLGANDLMAVVHTGAGGRGAESHQQHAAAAGGCRCHDRSEIAPFDGSPQRRVLPLEPDHGPEQRSRGQVAQGR